MKKRDRRSFSPEYKEAVRAVTESGRPLSQVARELDLRPEQPVPAVALAWAAHPCRYCTNRQNCLCRCEIIRALI